MAQHIPARKTIEPELQRPFLSKGEYVYQRLKEKIVDGSLERNKIYTIVEIAESLGVSRTPVGEAVKILGSQNYITLYPGVGFRVKELAIDEIRETLIITGALEEVVLRRIIKNGAAPSEELRDAVARSWQAIEEKSPLLYTQASADFHRALAGMSGLQKVTELLSENALAHEIWYREGAGRYPELVKQLVRDHELILDLIERREDCRITEVIGAHVENCEQILSKLITA